MRFSAVVMVALHVPAADGAGAYSGELPIFNAFTDYFAITT